MKRPRLALFLSLAYLTTVFLVVWVGLWAWERVYRLFSCLPGSPTVHLAGWIALLRLWHVRQLRARPVVFRAGSFMGVGRCSRLPVSLPLA